MSTDYITTKGPVWNNPTNTGVKATTLVAYDPLSKSIRQVAAILTDQTAQTNEVLGMVTMSVADEQAIMNFIKDFLTFNANTTVVAKNRVAQYLVTFFQNDQVVIGFNMSLTVQSGTTKATWNNDILKSLDMAHLPLTDSVLTLTMTT